MRAGSLIHRVEIQKSVKGARDAHGVKKKTWSVVETIRVGFVPMGGKEAEVARQTTPTLTHVANARYTANLSPSRRLHKLDDGRLFNIEAVLSVNERNREMEVHLKETVEE